MKELKNSTSSQQAMLIALTYYNYHDGEASKKERQEADEHLLEKYLKALEQGRKEHLAREQRRKESRPAA